VVSEELLIPLASKYPQYSAIRKVALGYQKLSKGKSYKLDTVKHPNYNHHPLSKPECAHYAAYCFDTACAGYQSGGIPYALEALGLDDDKGKLRLLGAFITKLCTKLPGVTINSIPVKVGTITDAGQVKVGRAFHGLDDTMKLGLPSHRNNDQYGTNGYYIIVPECRESNR
jgi:hypothetical protein